MVVVWESDALNFVPARSLTHFVRRMTATVNALVNLNGIGLRSLLVLDPSQHASAHVEPKVNRFVLHIMSAVAKQQGGAGGGESVEGVKLHGAANFMQLQ